MKIHCLTFKSKWYRSIFYSLSGHSTWQGANQQSPLFLYFRLELVCGIGNHSYLQFLILRLGFPHISYQENFLTNTVSTFHLKNYHLTFLSEGRSAAEMYDCKYIEVSAAIEHKVNDLLVGILKQIRLIKERNETAAPEKNKVKPKSKAKYNDLCCFSRAKRKVLSRLLRHGKYASKSCDNLYVL